MELMTSPTTPKDDDPPQSRSVFEVSSRSEKAHVIVHDHLVRETIFYCKGDSGHSKKAMG